VAAVEGELAQRVAACIAKRKAEAMLILAHRAENTARRAAAEAEAEAAGLKGVLAKHQSGGAHSHGSAVELSMAHHEAARAEERATAQDARAEEALDALAAERLRAQDVVCQAEAAQALFKRRADSYKHSLQAAEKKLHDQGKTEQALRESARRATQKTAGLQNKLAGNSKAAQHKSTKKGQKRQRKKLQGVVERVGRLEAVARKAAEEAVHLVVDKTALGGDGGRATSTDSGGNGSVSGGCGVGSGGGGDGSQGAGVDDGVGCDGGTAATSVLGGARGADNGGGGGGSSSPGACVGVGAAGGRGTRTPRKNAQKRQKAKAKRAATRLAEGGGGGESAVEALDIRQRFDALEGFVKGALEATKKRQGPSEMRKDTLLRQAKKKVQGLKRNRRNDHERWRNGDPAPNLSANQPRFTKSTAVRGGSRRHGYYGRLVQQPKGRGRGDGSGGGGGGGGGADPNNYQSGGRGGGGGGGGGCGSADSSASRTRQSDAAARQQRSRSSGGGGGGGGGGGAGGGSNGGHGRSSGGRDGGSRKRARGGGGGGDGSGDGSAKRGRRDDERR